MIRVVDRLEAVVMYGGFAPFPPDDLDAALERAAENDSTGIVRERLDDGTVGRTWHVQVDRHRLFEERRVELVEAVAA